MAKAKVGDSVSFPRNIIHTECSGYPQDYLEAKERVRVDSVTLKDGRKLSYFIDGDEHGTPVLCLPGGSEGKFMFLQREPFPGIMQISVDRMGYGDSDLVPDVTAYDFRHVADDITQLADHLEIGKFIVLGFSIGSSWAQQLAVALPERVTGIILFGTMADTGHPRATKELIKAIGKPPAVLDPVTGCCGFILRNAFNAPVKRFAKYNFTDMLTPDKKDKRCAPRFDVLKNDHFWICTKVDGCRAFTRPEAQLGDAYRSLCTPWYYDTAKITCPVYIFQGEFDRDMGSSSPAAPNFVKELVPHAVVEFIPGCGHASTVSPTELTRGQIIKAVDGILASITGESSPK